jgi:hypothetical protein
LKKGDDRGLFVEALLIELPGLKGSSGNRTIELAHRCDSRIMYLQ